MKRSKNLGLPAEHYFVSGEVRDYFRKTQTKLLARHHNRWEKSL